MLSRDHIQEAISFLNSLYVKGSKDFNLIKSTDNTPLNQLVDLSFYPKPLSTEEVPNDPELVDVQKADDNATIEKGDKEDGYMIAQNYLRSQDGCTEGTIIDKESSKYRDMQLKDFVTDISNVVNSHISFIKEIALPNLNNFTNRVKDIIKECSITPPSKGILIEAGYVPEVLLDETFNNPLRLSADKKPLTPDTTIELVDILNDEGLLKLIQCSSDSINKLLMNWYSHGHNSDVLRAVYMSIFTDKFISGEHDPYELSQLNVHSYEILNDQKVNGMNFNYYNNDDFGLLDKYLALYLLSTGLTKNTADVKNKTLAQYKRHMKQCVEYSASVICKFLNKIQYGIDSGMLINNITKSIDKSIREEDPTDYSPASITNVKVYGTVYEKWLKEGGSPEIILGSVINRDQILYNSYLETSVGTTQSSSKLIKNKDIYLKKWNAYSSILNAKGRIVNEKKVDKKIKILYKDMLKEEMSERELIYRYENMFEGKDLNFDKNFDVNDPKVKEALQTMTNSESFSLNLIKLESYLTLSDKEIDDLCMSMFGDIRYEFSACRDVLSEMTRVAEKDTNLNSKEAALLSTVKYIVFYLMRQTSIWN